MAGIYGEFLAFFSELFEDFGVYRHEDDTVSGYSLEKVGTVRGIRQSESYKASAGAPRTVPVLNVGAKYWLWTYGPVDMAREFVEIDGRMFRPVTESVFVREGGFYETVLELVVGNDGTKDMTPELAEGTY